MHSISLFYGFLKHILQAFGIMEHAVTEANCLTIRARGSYARLLFELNDFKMHSQLRRRLFQRAAFLRLRNTVTLP